MKITFRIILILVLFALLGFSAAVGAYRFDILSYNFLCKSDEFRYINPELTCHKQLHLSKNEAEALRLKLTKLIKEKVNKNEISEAAIYFRDFRDGPSIGIDEYIQFSPASLLKLPLLMAYYRVGERETDFLQRQLIYQNLSHDLTQEIVPAVRLEENKLYSINDLLTHMIIYSDNDAYYFLLDYLRSISPDEDLLLETYHDLGIINPKGILDETISVKSYAQILTRLYDGYFFNDKETSEKALKLLTETSFDRGLRAGVPEEIEVAHKFGERFGFAKDQKQLHDCGIIYYPRHPYLLCVMTRGFDNDKLSEAIASISQMVYKDFDSH